MIRNHIRRKANPSLPGTLLKVLVSGLTTQIIGNLVIIDRIGRRHRLRIAHDLFDRLRGARALPNPDKPQTCETPAAQPIELFIGDVVQMMDGTLIFPRQLVEPDVGALGNQHDVGHPVGIVAEGFHLGVSDIEPAGLAKSQYLGRALTESALVPLFPQNIANEQYFLE